VETDDSLSIKIRSQKKERGEKLKKEEQEENTIINSLEISVFDFPNEGPQM
jgi:hypothetical protein